MNDKKLAAICAAFGDAWDKVKDYVDENGWCCGIHAIKAGWSEDYDWNQGCWRPKSLSGIKDNNGWIRYDEKHPDVDQRIFYCLEGIPSPVPCDYHPTMPMCSLMTHWKPANAPKPPIY